MDRYIINVAFDKMILKIEIEEIYMWILSDDIHMYLYIFLCVGKGFLLKVNDIRKDWREISAIIPLYLFI